MERVNTQSQTTRSYFRLKVKVIDSLLIMSFCTTKNKGGTYDYKQVYPKAPQIKRIMCNQLQIRQQKHRIASVGQTPQKWLSVSILRAAWSHCPHDEHVQNVA